MNAQEEDSHGAGLGSILATVHLRLAGPSRRPIDPARALAILVVETAEAATAGADGLRRATGAFAQDIDQAIGLQ